MRFEKIKITNYRQYESIILDFPKEKESDLHIVVASNGIGKTNLLNAIDWCLYGVETHLGDKNESLSICNLGAMDRARDFHKPVVEVSVTIYAKENGTSLEFFRTVDVNATTSVPGIATFKVSRTPPEGNTEILEDEEAARVVDSYLPRKIKQYFFFDGEQLYNYFGHGQDTTHVKDSIHEIAQVNILTHVKDHLNSTITDKQKEIARLNPNTEGLLKEYENLKADLESKEADIEQLQSEIRIAEDKVDELNRKIAGTDTVVEDDKKYRKIKDEILPNLYDHRKKLDSDLSELIGRYYVLFILYDINKRTADYIKDKEQRGHLPPDINKELLLRSIEHGECAICQQHIGTDIKRHILELVNKFEVSSSVSNKLMEIKNDVNQACLKIKQYNKEKEEIFVDIRKTEKDINDYDKECNELYKRISSCSSVAEINSWMEQRDKAKKLAKGNVEKMGSYKHACEDLKNKIQLKWTQIDNATKGEQHSKELRNQQSIAKEAYEIVQSVEDEVVSEIREKMEKETFEIFSNLIWKQNTYGRIELNKDYRLRLFHVHGDSCLGSCSAAERELLALAFTLALHHVSHHDSLLFIDTPVGRVSDENRECFAKSLISVSKSKQLILAFTPSEYSVEISKYFDEVASSKTYLGTHRETATILM